MSRSSKNQRTWGEMGKVLYTVEYCTVHLNCELVVSVTSIMRPRQSGADRSTN